MVPDQVSDSGGRRGKSGRFNREYRRLATGLCFLVFFSGGILVSILAAVFTLLPLSAMRRKRLCVGLLHGCMRFFMKFMCTIRVIEHFEVRGYQQELDDCEPKLWVGNHPSLIDIVAILSVVKSSNCIVKKELFNNPFIGVFIRRAGLLPNDYGPDLMAAVDAEFKAGNSLIVFPEGTRSPKGGLHSFKRGVAQIALRTGANLSPIIVRCEPSTLRKDQPWYDVPDRPVRFSLDFKEPIPVTEAIHAEPEMPLKARLLNREIERYFHQALNLPFEMDSAGKEHCNR